MSVPSDRLPPDRVGSPGSLIVTFVGCYLRQIGGWIAVADLIRLLEPSGVTGTAVRQAVGRLKARGFLASERRGSTAGYALTDAGRRDLIPGDSRIFRYGQADLADGWILASFSVPEAERAARHQLRKQLRWLGFGTVGSGVWIAPAALTEPARRLLADGGLDTYVTWFHAHALDRVDPAAWWDLAELRNQYDAFVDQWRQHHSDPAPLADDSSFTVYLALVDSWRVFPRIDPGLPAVLLDADWPGPRAWEVFTALRERWESAGLRHVQGVTGAASS